MGSQSRTQLKQLSSSSSMILKCPRLFQLHTAIRETYLMLNPVVTLKRPTMSKMPCVNHQSGIQSKSYIEIYFFKSWMMAVKEVASYLKTNKKKWWGRMEGKEGCEQNCGELTKLKPSWGTSLVVQRLRPHLPGLAGSIPSQGLTCLSHASQSTKT